MTHWSFIRGALGAPALPWQQSGLSRQPRPTRWLRCFPYTYPQSLAHCYGAHTEQHEHVGRPGSVKKVLFQELMRKVAQTFACPITQTAILSPAIGRGLSFKSLSPSFTAAAAEGMRAFQFSTGIPDLQCNGYSYIVPLKFAAEKLQATHPELDRPRPFCNFRPRQERGGLQRFIMGRITHQQRRLPPCAAFCARRGSSRPAPFACAVKTWAATNRRRTTPRLPPLAFWVRAKALSGGGKTAPLRVRRVGGYAAHCTRPVHRKA